MALSGNLRDFDISYIFQIIAQENKTGKLVLCSNDIEAYIVYKNGKIISAGTTNESPLAMIFRYLSNVKKTPKNVLAELHSHASNNLRQLSSILAQKKMLCREELSSIIETGIEDLACSIFFWKQGNYRFDSLPNTDLYQFEDFSISADAITMEAARRLDEFERFRKHIKKDSVFILTETESDTIDQTMPENVFENFDQYLFCLIDGTSSTDYLCKISFFSEYQVYTSLYNLLEDKIISVLPDKISHSINAALHRTHNNSDTLTSNVMLSAIITATIIFSIYFCAQIIIKGIVFSDNITESSILQNELSRSKSLNKMAIGMLLHHGLYGKSNKSTPDLISKKILSKRDFPESKLSISNKTEKTRPKE